MNKDLIGVAAKTNNAVEESAAIELFKLGGYSKHKNYHVEQWAVADLVGVDTYNKIVRPTTNDDSYRHVTLDQLAWDYGLANDDCKYCILDENDRVYFTASENISPECSLISTRPKQTLQNGDYLPVSEIKTEQDYKDVIEAAENCGISQYRERAYSRFEGIIIKNFYGIVDGVLFLYDYKDQSCKNKLTLTQWKKRGGVKTEGVKEKKKLYGVDYSETYTPKVGDKVIVKNFSEGRDWKLNFEGKAVDVTSVERVGEDTHVGISYLDTRVVITSKALEPLPTPEEAERKEFAGNYSEDVTEFAQYVIDNGYNDTCLPNFLFDKGYRKTK